MCGRFHNAITWAGIQARYSLCDKLFSMVPLSHMQLRYNVAPTKKVDTVHLNMGGNLEIEPWRRLASRTTECDAEIVRPIAEQHFGLKWDVALAEVVANAEDMAASSRPAPVLAAEIAAAIYRARPDAELLAFWLADILLAQRLRWPVPVPLLMRQASSQVFKSGENRKRIRPGGEGWGRGVFLAYAAAAAEACELGADLAERAGRLTRVAPKLRAKGSGDVIKLLLSDDAVPGSWSSSKLSARGARRLFDRLGELGDVPKKSPPNSRLRTNYWRYGTTCRNR